METRELRIGNLLMYQDIVVTVNYLNEVSIGWGNGFFSPVMSFKPIPLTKEWFNKFGYYNENRPDHFEKDGYTIDAHTFWICNEMFIDDKNAVRIKYVHQLQNLFFALKQRELAIKNQE